MPSSTPHADVVGASGTSGRLPALIGCGMAMLCGLALSGLRVANSPAPELESQVIGNVAFLAVYLVPFGLGLVATRWINPAHRAVVWSAGFLVALLASFTAFSGASLIFLPAVPLLGVAAIRALWGLRLRLVVTALVISLLLAAFNTGAFLSLLVHEDGRCWELVREVDGSENWREIPYGTTLSASADGTGAVAGICDSNIITPLEGALALALLAIQGLGLGVVLSRWQSSVSLSSILSTESDSA